MRRLIVAMAMSLAMCAGSARGQSDGRSLYFAKCSACHAPDGGGNNTIGRSLRLSDMRPAIKSMTDDQLREIILQGKGKMPPNKKLDDEKIRNLTLFLHDLAAGNPDTGRAVTQAQAQPMPDVGKVYQAKCSACHAQDGTGRTTIGKSLKIPDLTSVTVQSRRIEELAEIISKGKGRMPGYMKTFNSAQVGQLVSYVRGLAESGSVRAPVEGPRAPVSARQTPPPMPTQMTAQPESTSPAPSSADSTALKRPPKVEERKTVEPQAASVPAARNAPGSGRQIYIAKCTACHSRDGSGSGTIGKSMRIPSLTSPQVQARSDENLASVISKGTGKMPAYKKKYSPEEIRLLVAYIRELARK